MESNALIINYLFIYQGCIDFILFFYMKMNNSSPITIEKKITIWIIYIYI